FSWQLCGWSSSEDAMFRKPSSFTANKVLPSFREVGVDGENGNQRMAKGNGLRAMGKGRKGQWNGFRPVVTEGKRRTVGTRRQACRRVPALMALVFVCAAAIFVFAWVVR